MPLVAAPLGADAIRLNSQREAHVIIRGRRLVERAGMRLPALHQALYAATVPTQCPGMDSKAIRAAIGAGARRGKAKAKAAVGGGRSPWGKYAMTAAQRQRLHRARTALREVVRELRLALGSGSDMCESLQAGPPCKRVLSAAERQEVHRARRVRREHSR